ncbi:MAG: hypothetical protein QOK01_1403 [Alphaproteobacteria bacterium]|jgi:hypothetical protein|nr:hypothetical protein [Alphaproteobacteria bacterium]
MMPRLAATMVLGLGLALGLAACTQESGYVEIKVAPGFTVPPLMLGSSRVDIAKRGSAILRERVGPATLAFEREGRMISFCEFDVRRNRIVTVAITAVGRDPRCKLQG